MSPPRSLLGVTSEEQVLVKERFRIPECLLEGNGVTE